MKTKTKKESGARSNTKAKKASAPNSHGSTKVSKSSSGTTRADYEDEDAAIDRAAK